MNGVPNVSQKPTIVQIIAVVSAALLAILLEAAIAICAVYKIYIEPTMLMLIGTVLGGLCGALTTILVGRSLAQLNESDTNQQQPIFKPQQPPP